MTQLQKVFIGLLTLLMPAFFGVDRALAVPFNITAQNGWATISIVSSTSGAAGAYTQTWSLPWSPQLGAAAMNAKDHIASLGWQPGVITGPNSWATTSILSPTGTQTWSLPWSPQLSAAAMSAKGHIAGLGWQPGALGAVSNPYAYTLTMPGGPNSTSYHIQFAYPRGIPSATPGIAHAWNPNSLSADVPPPPVPEPASLALLGSGLAGLGLWRRKRLAAKRAGLQ